jgi:hypothetical protein
MLNRLIPTHPKNHLFCDGTNDDKRKFDNSVTRGPPKLKQRPTFMTTSMSAAAAKPKLLLPSPPALKQSAPPNVDLNKSMGELTQISIH